MAESLSFYAPIEKSPSKSISNLQRNKVPKRAEKSVNNPFLSMLTRAKSMLTRAKRANTAVDLNKDDLTVNMMDIGAKNRKPKTTATSAIFSSDNKY